MSAALASPDSVVLGYKPRPWQVRAHRLIAQHRWSILAIHRRAGKTVLAILVLIDAALRCTKGDGRYGYLAPYLKQAKQVAWQYLKTYASRVPGTKISEGELWIEFSNGARITIDGADNPDGLLGRYWDGVVLDEYARMRPGVYTSTLRPALADRKGWGLFISTTHGMDAFYELWERAIGKRNWGTLKLDVYDTGVLPQSEIDDSREIMSDQEFRQEYLCDFTASAANVLITIDIVVDAMRRKVPSTEYLKGLPRVMGVDVARFGDDKSVIQKRWGHFAYRPMKYRKVDNMQLVGLVGQEINAFKPDVVFIDGGRGEGVIDRLRQLGHTNVIEVQFGSQATDPHYSNRRAEMWDTMREWIATGGVLPDDTDLKRDLCVLTYEYDPAGRMKLERKEKVKERNLPSPDCADALALTFAEPVLPRRDEYDHTGESTEAGGRTHTEYDVMASLSREAA